VSCSIARKKEKLKKSLENRKHAIKLMTNNKKEELGDSFFLLSKNVFQSRKCSFLRSLLARVTFITLNCPYPRPTPEMKIKMTVAAFT
jgi:hypothetical protein